LIGRERRHARSIAHLRSLRPMSFSAAAVAVTVNEFVTERHAARLVRGVALGTALSGAIIPPAGARPFWAGGRPIGTLTRLRICANLG